MLKEFRDFLLRGNLVTLAVAFVMGVAFAAVVTSFVNDLVMPVIAVIFGKPEFNQLTFTINDAVFRYGAVVTAAITFVSTAAAIFFGSVWFYASHGRRLLHPDADPRMVSGITRSYLPGAPIYATATLVGLVSAEASAALYGLIAAFYMVSSAFFGQADE